MAVGQNQWYHFGVGAPPIFSGGCSLGVRDFEPWPYSVAACPWSYAVRLSRLSAVPAFKRPRCETTCARGLAALSRVTSCAQS